MDWALPYYAVIFTSELREENADYSKMAAQMEELCKKQPGFLGMDHARSEKGITVCYWESLESIANWKNNALHQEAQHLGKNEWYKSYSVRICKVEKSYGLF
jgi:heme-degrading monooxygenase HmoA